MIKAQRLFLISMILISIMLITIGALFSFSKSAYADPDPDPEPPTTYDITWLDFDDTPLKVDTVEEGVVPDYGTPPTKPSDSENAYTFNGWDPQVVAATQDATYKATYLAHPFYTIELYDEDLDATPTCINGSDLDKIYDLLQAHRTRYYYEYSYEDGTLLSPTTYVSQNVKIIRKAQYKVSVTTFINELFQGKQTNYYYVDQTIDVAAIYGNDPKFNTKYYNFDPDASIRKEEITDPTQVVLNDFPYIYNDEIEFDMCHEKISVLIRNDQTSATTTVYYKYPYGTLFSNPSKVGYTFKGWSYKGEVIDSTTIVETKQEHTLAAVFEANKYSVTFNYPDGQTRIADVYFDSKIPVVDQAKKTGYTFASWQLEGEDFDIYRQYRLTKSIELYPRFTANTYKANIAIDDVVLVTHEVVFDSENVTFIGIDEGFPGYDTIYVLGLYYEEGGEMIPVCGADMVIDKWTYPKDMTFQLALIFVYTSFEEKVNLDEYIDIFDLKVTIDGEEYKEKTNYSKIGIHNIMLKDKDDNLVFTKDFVIYENFGFKSGDVLSSPIYLKNIDAEVYVDGEKVTDLATFRIDKAGIHSITVLGANGYENTYAVTYNNKNLKRGWWIFGISCGFMCLALAFAIIGRRKVVMYYGKH